MADIELMKQKYCPDGFEFIEYYPGQQSHVLLKCKECGDIKKWATSSFRGKWSECKHQCPQCLKRERDKRREEKEQEQQRERERRKKEREANRKVTQLSFHICPVCSKAFTGHGSRKFCSERCLKKAKRVTYRHTRRAHLNNQIIDKDITLKGLALRDNNVCWLCQKMVDWNDYSLTDSIFVSGERYPSIDHVVPLSKNGTHAWNNVRLAHFGCNRAKGAEIV